VNDDIKAHVCSYYPVHPCGEFGLAEGDSEKYGQNCNISYNIVIIIIIINKS